MRPQHPANQDPTLEGHTIQIETQVVETSYDGTSIAVTQHRWRCSCGAAPGEWKLREGQARIGGTKHATKSRGKRS